MSGGPSRRRACIYARAPARRRRRTNYALACMAIIHARIASHAVSLSVVQYVIASARHAADSSQLKSRHRGASLARRTRARGPCLCLCAIGRVALRARLFRHPMAHSIEEQYGGHIRMGCVTRPPRGRRAPANECRTLRGSRGACYGQGECGARAARLPMVIRLARLARRDVPTPDRRRLRQSNRHLHRACASSTWPRIPPNCLH